MFLVDNFRNFPQKIAKLNDFYVSTVYVSLILRSVGFNNDRFLLFDFLVHITMKLLDCHMVK